MTLNTDGLKEAFVRAAQLARLELHPSDVLVELIVAPHQRPRSLPLGKQAVYCFLLGEGCLKVGKAGPKTKARFTSSALR